MTISCHRLLSDVHIEKDTLWWTPSCTKKRGTHAAARSNSEVFELTRLSETSNEDPTLYVYSTLLSLTGDTIQASTTYP